jgi:hypothetical protein
MNLGWKLAATIQNRAPEGLLDSYFTERHPIGAQVLDWSRAQVAIMKPCPSSRALNAIFRDLVNTRDGATYFAGRVWGISTRYDLGSDHLLVGTSVPNFELQDGTQIGELMHDGRGLLLDFDSSRYLKNLASEYGKLMRYVSGPAKEQFGLHAVLIRPDGIIAWVCDGDADEKSIERVVSSWFVR